MLSPQVHCSIPSSRPRALATALLTLGPIAAAAAQTAAGPIDDCGQLVQGATCVLVEVGGGRYVLTDFYGYRVGDAVRVVGEIDPDCITICADADGCIRGAVLYDPAQFPCGQPLPNLAADICTGVASGLTFPALGLLLFAPRSWRRKHT
ncbi:MAG: hypothetical protein LC135_11415 [Phycisphaerae bacterium]|jgi:hypothetical protein|nr:hypothetical protein [Phycisphaerae bacterium]MCZ2400456.1 hypothetical protein [Phycisphaerae bacterium]NUQ50042.1 hypothetical protein [Phycisphaerae bacterium]